MNSGLINGFGLNSPTSGGSNATLVGGLMSAMVFSAALMAGAVLAGGIETQTEAGGRVSQLVSGGVYSDSQLGGKQFYTANLQNGVFSIGGIGSNLGLASGINGGTYSPSGFGGELLCDTRLQTADTIGDTSLVEGQLSTGAGLSGGTGSNTWVSAQIIGSTVLVSGGGFSNSTLGGVLNTGFTIEGGTESQCSVGGSYFITALLLGGITSYATAGKSLQVGANLHDGMVQVGVVGSPSMRIHAELDGGIGSNTDFTAQILISVHGNDGVYSNSQTEAKMRKDEKLLGGAVSDTVFDSVNLRAAQRLPGGVYCGSNVGGTQRINTMMLTDFYSTARLNGNLQANVRLRSDIYSDGFTGSGLVASVRLLGGAASSSISEANLTINSPLVGGIDGACGLGGQLISVPFLSDGVASDDMVGGNFVQQFVDPLLNTWALSIRSATPILSVQTPLQDI